MMDLIANSSNFNHQLNDTFSPKDLMQINTTKKSLQITTLTSLLSQDIPNGAILLEFPSSSNRSLRFVNDEKYLIYDFPPPSAFYNEYLLPLRACPVAGDQVPLLLSGHPSELLQEHWKSWVPGYVKPVIKTVDITNTGYDPIVVSFPHQRIPAHRHAVDPDVHYWVLSKRCIPYMGTTSPRHMTPENYTLPCMVKAAHGKGTKGTFKVTTEEEMEQISKELKNNLGLCEPPVITEVIENIEGNYCLQFYLFRTGELHWLGVTTQIIGNSYVWGGGVVDWEKQCQLKELLYDTILPVKEFLHKKGYFGIVGIDILTNKNGKYVIDVNPRMNGTTPQLLLSPRMAPLGFSASIYLADGRFACSTKRLLQTATQMNSEREVLAIVLSMADVEHGCEAHVVVFGKTEQRAREGYDRLMGN